jgi:GTPase
MIIMENHRIVEIVLLGIIVVVAALGVEEEDLEVAEIIFQAKIETTMMMIMIHPPTLKEDLEAVEDPQMIWMMVNMMTANQRTLKGFLTMLIGLLLAYIIMLNYQHLTRK